MLYKKFPPSPSVSQFVECYFAWEGDAPEPITVQSPPNGYCGIVINYGETHTASQADGPTSPVPRAFVSGQFTSNYKIHLHGKIGMVGIVLKPTAVYNCFGVRMSELVNSRAPLTFLSAIDVSKLIDDVSREDDLNLRIDALGKMIATFIPKAKASLSIIDEAVDYIDQQRGCVSVEAVANHLKISRRYLEKKFSEKVGVSPKYYSRLRRFGALSNIIAHHKIIDWQAIVQQYGFHDQSHLVKEFMEFNQMNPTQYHLLHQEMTRYIRK